jgi:hypothetical protein
MPLHPGSCIRYSLPMCCDRNNYLNDRTMKEQTKELIKAEQRRSDYGFITEIVQRGRIKPAKYCNSVTIPSMVFDEMKILGIIEIENYFIDESAFFEFKNNKVIVSFINISAVNDFHIRAAHYLLTKAYGFDPIERKAASKMNQDKVHK